MFSIYDFTRVICFFYVFINRLLPCLFQPKLDELAKRAFCSWVRAYTAYKGDLKKIFLIKKLHLGHVAKSFALKQQPSLVGKSFQKQIKKRKRYEKNNGLSNKRKVARVT